METYVPHCFLSFSLFSLSVSPGKIRTLSLEVSTCPSLYQVSVGGGTALVSQYREMGLLSITSRMSPPKPGGDVVSPTPPGLLKLGGTEGVKKGEKMFNVTKAITSAVLQCYAGFLLKYKSVQILFKCIKCTNSLSEHNSISQPSSPCIFTSKSFSSSPAIFVATQV